MFRYRNIFFLKILFGYTDRLCLHFLLLLLQVVPKRFLKHFTAKLSGTIKLELPSRGSYSVEVKEHFSKVVFRNGWEEFVESHHIEENDYLLFRHVEGSCFEVSIFDADGCEKVFSCAGISVDYVDISSSSRHEITESSASERCVRRQKGSSCYHGKMQKWMQHSHHLMSQIIMLIKLLAHLRRIL